MKQNEVVLEKSTNTHKLVSDSDIATSKISNEALLIETKGKGILLHGEHGTLVTESDVIVKYNQQEYNPVTQKMRNAFD